MVTTDERIEALERRVEGWERRLRQLEPRAPEPVQAEAAPAPRAFATETDLMPPQASPPPAPPASRPEPAPPAPRPQPPAAVAPSPSVSFEQLFGGRVLAWLGGIAVLAGLAFLFALGVSSGWLDESRRCALGVLVATGLLGAGAYLQERRGRTTAGLASAGAGLAGLFLALSYATQGYDLMPTLPGAVLGAAIGALGTALALRWNASAVGGIGLVGAALSPALSGATGEPGGVVLLWLAAAAGVAVVVHRRWGWMAVALAIVVTPQWLLFLVDFGSGEAGLTLPTTLLVLVGFGALGVFAAIGYELRVPAAGLRPSSTFLLAGTALVLALSGYPLLEDVSGQPAAIAWLFALALGHVGAGLAARRSELITDELALLILAIGAVLADVAFALALDGAPRAIGWTTSVVAYAWLVRGAKGCLDPGVAQAGLGVHLVLAWMGVLGELDGQFSGDAALSASAGATLAAFAAASFTSARLASAWRQPLDVLGLCAVAGLSLLTLDGAALTVAWAAQAIALTTIAARTSDPLAGVAALVHLVAAAVWCLADQASPTGLAEPVEALGTAALGLGAVTVASARLALLARKVEGELSGVLGGAAAVTLLYLASLTAVAVDPGAGGAMQGQLQLTALWALVGVGALVAGLRRDVADLRFAALGLLGLAAAKLFVVDLTTLAAAWRVAACIGVGVLLLMAAFVHARLRPEPLPDMRESESSFR